MKYNRPWQKPNEDEKLTKKINDKKLPVRSVSRSKRKKHKNYLTNWVMFNCLMMRKICCILCLRQDQLKKTSVMKFSCQKIKAVVSSKIENCLN